MLTLINIIDTIIDCMFRINCWVYAHKYKRFDNKIRCIRCNKRLI